MAGLSPAYEAIRRLVEQQHDAAVTALRESAGLVDAVAWISVHISVAGRVLYPAVRRTGRAGRRLLGPQGAIDHELLEAVWHLDRRLTGDARNASLPLDGLVGGVHWLLGRHELGEQRLLAELSSLGRDKLGRLHDDIMEATVNAPTRPHPLVRKVGPAAAIAFRAEATVDRLRDVLDSRRVPVPRHDSTRKVPGRWGLYALGVPETFPQEDTGGTAPQEDNAGGGSTA